MKVQQETDMTSKADNTEILTLPEVARYLKIAEKTVLRMAHRGAIPAAKVGNQWRFLKPVIDNWLLTKMDNTPQVSGFARLVDDPETGLMPLSRLLHESFVVPDLPPGTKEEILSTLIAPLVENNLLKDGTAYLHKLIAREQLLSTALERGIAVPHIRNPKENPPGLTVIVTGRCPAGTDFDAPDEEPTRLFFLIVTDSESVHLRLLAKLSKILSDEKTVQAILAAPDERAIIDTV
ncbi:MAG TPA: helix-turn-helix domain-containing protein, partial [Spirochaetia bacterium]|nr:helix-turn-helix domain-containing protein [Spirochaetia bacterium]